MIMVLQIQQLHHQALPLTTKGGQYLESLLLKLLSSLLVSQPKTVQVYCISKHTNINVLFLYR